MYVGDQIRTALNNIAAVLPGIVKDVRGWGLINGVELESGITSSEVANLLLESGVLVVPAGNDIFHFQPYFSS